MVQVYAGPDVRVLMNPKCVHSRKAEERPLYSALGEISRLNSTTVIVNVLDIGATRTRELHTTRKPPKIGRQVLSVESNQMYVPM